MGVKKISHYEILEPLGQGGMGTVYRAVDTRLGRPVALKLLRPGDRGNGEARKRFVQEARAASALSHPHIITIYDIGQDDGVDFIAMEYVSGQPLARLIQRGGLNVAEALRYAAQVADALAAAHAAGIVHRDLKPSNIVVSPEGVVKVLDFGVAKLMESTGRPASDGSNTTATGGSSQPVETEEGTILGTAAYMSPEQAEGRRADARSDVFSFGAVLYEMITGCRAFQGETKVSTLAAVLATDPVPADRLVRGLPPDLVTIMARCLRKSPQRRWQSMADVKLALDDLLEDTESRGPAEPDIIGAGRRPTRRAIWLLAGLAVAVGAVAFSTWWRPSWRPSGPRPSLVRLTSDLGWTDYPAISPDGKILAYASDRSGEGNLDIWVQQIPDGSPVRLTRNGADDVDPSFSADGSKIAFQSSRAGGGIYIVPTLGGTARLLAERGFSPRFSPDGRWVAYGLVEPRGSQIHVAPAAGGPATLVTAGFYLALAPVWSPDGQSLLFWGQRDRDVSPEGNVDWWVVPAAGGPPVGTGARATLIREGFQAFHGLPTADGWLDSGSRVVFHAQVGDSSNVWQVAISPKTWQVSDAPQRVTFGTTNEAAASVNADGRMVFSSLTIGADIWTLPIDADRGIVRGPLTRLTQDLADDYDPTLSADGDMLAFRSRRAGQFDVFLKNLSTGQETVLTETQADEYPAISPNGTKVAYSMAESGSTPVYVVAASGGTPEVVCRSCGRVEQWAPDGQAILFVAGDDRSAVGLLTLSPPSIRDLIRHPAYGVFHARFSPDGQWVSFGARANRLAPTRVFVARAEGSAVGDESEWTVVTEDGEAPAWSPGGGLLYFWSNRDGSPCLWAQRLDPSTKRPSGSPLSIQHFHNRGLSWRNLYLGPPSIAVARDRVVFNLGEHTGSIWMTDLPAMRDR